MPTLKDGKVVYDDTELQTAREANARGETARAEAAARTEAAATATSLDRLARHAQDVDPEIAARIRALPGASHLR